jgi:hypothetical protein
VNPTRRRQVMIAAAVIGLALAALVLRRRQEPLDAGAVGPLFDPLAEPTDGAPALGDVPVTIHGNPGDVIIPYPGAEPIVIPPAPGPEPTPATEKQGFWAWVGGGKSRRQVFVTCKNKAVWIAELKRRGKSADVWASRYPDKARLVCITPPATPAPKRATATAPRGTPVPGAPRSSSIAVHGEHPAARHRTPAVHDRRRRARGRRLTGTVR